MQSTISVSGGWAVLKSEDDIPELSRVSGHTEEYLKQRFDHAQAVGRLIYPHISWNGSQGLQSI
jgi:hypothetical protein